GIAAARASPSPNCDWAQPPCVWPAREACHAGGPGAEAAPDSAGLGGGALAARAAGLFGAFFAGHVLAPAGHVGRVVKKHSVTTHRAPMRSSLRLCVVFS